MIQTAIGNRTGGGGRPGKSRGLRATGAEVPGPPDDHRVSRACRTAPTRRTCARRRSCGRTSICGPFAGRSTFYLAVPDCPELGHRRAPPQGAAPVPGVDNASPRETSLPTAATCRATDWCARSPCPRFRRPWQRWRRTSALCSSSRCRGLGLSGDLASARTECRHGAEPFAPCPNAAPRSAAECRRRVAPLSAKLANTRPSATMPTANGPDAAGSHSMRLPRRSHPVEGSEFAGRSVGRHRVVLATAQNTRVAAAIAADREIGIANRFEHGSDSVRLRWSGDLVWADRQKTSFSTSQAREPGQRLSRGDRIGRSCSTMRNSSSSNRNAVAARCCKFAGAGANERACGRCHGCGTLRVFDVGACECGHPADRERVAAGTDSEIADEDTPDGENPEGSYHA